MDALTKEEAESKYSPEYLRLLINNPWVESYMTASIGKNEEKYKSIRLISADYLLDLLKSVLPTDSAEEIEFVNTKMFTVNKTAEGYVVTYTPWQEGDKEKSYSGSCPEEALLKLFIALEAGDASKRYLK